MASTSTAQPLPPTHRALVFERDTKKLSVQTIPTPTVIPGSVVIRVVAGTVEPALSHILHGEIRGLTLAPSSVPGTRAVGRVAAVGEDATSLKPGQLVMLDCFVRGRDDPNGTQLLLGAGVFGDNAAAEKLMNDVWLHGTSAEYVRAPLENVHVLDERALLGSPDEGGLGYDIADLLFLPRQVVAYGGLRSIDLKAGETIIVAPATGAYSGAAVDAAVAMGARVIAASRNMDVLTKLAAAHPPGRVVPVQLSGSDVQGDLARLRQVGAVDAYLDLSPAAADESTHVRSCLMAVRPYGRVALMGIVSKDIAMPYMLAVLNNLTIRGQYMYEREDVRGVIKLAETGVLRLGERAGHKVVGRFAIEQWESAIEVATGHPEAGSLVVFDL